MIDWAIGAAMVLATAALLWMIVTGRPSRGERSGGIASLSAFHDFQAKDRQNAVEVIIEQKAGKKLEEQSTGEGKKHESEQVHD
jgi:hypothetical protein